MRILFLSQLLPLPLDAGPKIRAYYVLRYLAEAGHEVTLLCFTRPGDDQRSIDSLREICSSVETVPLVRSRLKDLSNGSRSLLSATPFLVLRDQLPSMEAKLNKVLASRSFDALHADQLWMAPYSMRKAGPNLRVLDQHNAVFMIPRRMAEHERNPLARAFFRLEASKLETYERQACQAFAQVVWVTDQDQKAVGYSGANHTVRNRVIPIATDTATRPAVKRSGPFRVTFLGGMHWPPNAEGVSWFAERVWPRVLKAAPSAVLTLIGRGAPKKLCRQEPGPKVEITGYVGDLERYLCETAAFIVPLRSGAGMRVKILDAWCWGLPIVSTSVGAEGISAVHGENLLIADEEETFADCLVRVMQERALAQRLSENGRTAVEMLYDWRKVYKAWDQIYH